MNMRKIDISQWTQVGEGGNGVTYENPEDPDILLKVNKSQLNSLEIIEQEFNLSRAVAELGFPTPALHEIVLVGDAYGVIQERIKEKKSLFRICHDEPRRIEEMARLFSSLAKQLFSTPCNTEFFPSRKQTAAKGLAMAAFVSRKNRTTLQKFLESVPENTHCVHGDFQPGNVILSAGKPYWIDLGRFAWGDPMFDIGHLYLSCVVYSKMKQARDIFHMTRDQLLLFWDVFAKDYTGLEDHTAFDREAARFAAADMVSRVYYQKPTWLENLFFRFQLGSLMNNFE